MADAARQETSSRETSLVPQPSRIKRNSACTACRDAKVRCNPSSVAHQPCQRCARLNYTCVVDKTFKRVSRRSKLDELVQEIQSIKQSVGSASTASLQQSYAAPAAAAAVTTTSRDPPPPQQLGLPSPSGVSSGAGSSTQPTTAPRVLASASIEPSAALGTPGTAGLHDDLNFEPSPPRTLGSYPFSGEDIDYYFDKFFKCYHPYMPVVRQRDPKKCYETCPLLFWTIIYVGSRRYAKSPSLIQFLSEEIRRQVFAALGELTISLPTINAIILICSWLFPAARFINDSSVILSSVMANAALQLGIHTGKGGHPEYSHGVFCNNYADEEATYTWAGLNIVAQRVSSYMGLPPVTSLFNQTIRNTIDGQMPFHVPSGFRILLECQKFSNHVSKVVLAHLEESTGVSVHIVEALEDEWDILQGLICTERASDLDKFNALLVKLEIQLFYFVPPAGHRLESQRPYIVRVFQTASSVLRNARELDQKIEFLGHITHFQLRSVVSAACVIFRLLRSSYMRFLDVKTVEAVAADAAPICMRMSVVEGDLAVRLSSLLKTFLELYHSSGWTTWANEEPTVTGFPHRLGASITFDCLLRWKHDGTMQRAFGQQQQQQQQLSNSNTGCSDGAGQESDTLLPSTALPDQLDIDWSFLDDLDLTFGPNLGPPIQWWHGMVR